MEVAFDLAFEIEGLPPAKSGQAPLSANHPHIERTRMLLQAVRLLLPSDFRPLATSVGLELTLRTPSARQAWDATNYLGGIADVLQNKNRRVLPHLGELAAVSVYENDRVIREVSYQHELSDKVGYRLRIWALDRHELESARVANQVKLSVEPRRVRSPELCIDFVNTLVLPDNEKLGTYEDVLRWAAEAAIVTPENLHSLRTKASLRPTEAERSIVAARRLREAIRRSLLHDRTVDDLDQVTEFLQRYLPLRRLKWLDGDVQWVWPERIDLEQILWPVAQSAHALLTSDRLGRVRACVSCRQLFFDMSRNGRRRWCDMKACGNRAKAHRFQLRHPRTREKLQAAALS